MIGNKKLSEIQQELRRAATRLGNDPIRRLEKTVANGQRKQRDSTSDPVLESLRRILEEPKKRTRKKKPARST